MRQLKTQLLDRELRFDGASVVSPEQVAEFLLLGVPASQLRVTQLDEDAKLFNAEVPEEDALRLDGDPVKLSFEWRLPASYLELDVYEVVGRAYEKKTEELYKRYSQQQYDYALERISAELAEFERRGMMDFLRTIIYILDTFREKQVVWGVGRGSSCASFVLFLLGLHAVDPVFYSIPMEEFFHD